MGVFRSLFKPSVGQLAERNDVRGLVDCTKQGGEQIKDSAYKALREMDLKDVQAVHMLCVALGDEDACVRMNASLGLGLAMGKLGMFSPMKFNQMAPEAIESLMPIFVDEDSGVRSMGATALSQLSPSFDVTPVVRLLSLAEDADKDVGTCAKRALSFWEIESRSPAALQALRDRKSMAYKSNNKLGKALYEMFEDSLSILAHPRAIDPVFLEAFEGCGLTPDAQKELAKRVEVQHEQYGKAQELSQDPELSPITREFYRRIFEYWRANFEGKEL